MHKLPQQFDLALRRKHHISKMKIEVWNGEGKDILYLLQKQLQLTQIIISLLNSLSPWGDTNDCIEI